MEQRERTRQLLITHYQTYPQLQIQDLFKFLYQSSFGCEHMVSSLEAVTDGIRRESDHGCQDDPSLMDILDGAYCRVHLAYLKQGLSAETLGKLFFASAKNEPDGISGLEQKLEAAKELVREGALPFASTEFETAIAEWAAVGYPALHHSDIFRAAYHPAYRVIAKKYVRFLPLFARLDELNGSAVVAVEGGSASGKTTLGETLKTLYDCTVFHMDDFFLRPEQRTPERYAEAGGNIDWERFLEEVLIPLRKNEPVNYRRFDCATFTIAPPVKVKPAGLVIVEGAYAMHPELAAYYDFSVFLDITPALQSARIRKRNTPEMAERFFREWVPLERTYFSKMQVKSRCDMSIPIDGVE